MDDTYSSKETYIREKRHTKETYRDIQKRLIKETYKRDMWMRLMNETYKSDLWMTRIRQKRHIFEKEDAHKRDIQ